MSGKIVPYRERSRDLAPSTPSSGLEPYERERALEYDNGLVRERREYAQAQPGTALCPMCGSVMPLVEQTRTLEPRFVYSAYDARAPLQESYSYKWRCGCGWEFQAAYRPRW